MQHPNSHLAVHGGQTLLANWDDSWCFHVRKGRCGRCWINQESDANHIHIVRFCCAWWFCSSGHASLGYRLVRMKQSPPCRMAWRNNDIMTAGCTVLAVRDMLTHWYIQFGKVIAKHKVGVNGVNLYIYVYIYIFQHKHFNFTHVSPRRCWGAQTSTTRRARRWPEPTHRDRDDRGCDRYTKRRRSHPAPRNARVLKMPGNVPNPMQSNLNFEKVSNSLLKST